MAYTINWNSAEPIGSTLPAGQLDDEIRKTKQATEERMATIIGNNNWATNVDPVIDGANIRSLAALSSEVTAKASINATNNFIPKRAGAGIFTDSAMSDDGTTIDTSTRTIKFRGISYNWPVTATPGLFLQAAAVSGTLVTLNWVSAAAVGAVGGGGTTGKIPLWATASSLSDSVMSQSAGIVTVAGSLVVNTSITGASLTLTGAVNAASVSVSASVSTPELNVGIVKLTQNVAGSKNTMLLQNVTPSGTGVAFDINVTNGEYRVGGTKVVGPRITGWGIPTGTATRTTFATDSVTLIELARRLKALVDDLTTHGVIGA